MPRLVVPDARFQASFRESHREWQGAVQDGAGLYESDDVETIGGFATWVDRLIASETEPRFPGQVTATYRWIIEGDDYLGAVSFRHELTEWLLNYGGHIGYGVRPPARRRGLASWALGETLDLARGRGHDRVLVCCLDDNVASARTIEGHGGVLEDARRDGDELVRRYWIDLS